MAATTTDTAPTTPAWISPYANPTSLEGAQMDSMGIQNHMLGAYSAYQDQIMPIQYQEMVKGIGRADEQFARDGRQQDFMMDYNRSSLAANERASAGANAAAMANAQAAGASAAANGMIAQTNSRLADSSIKMNDYQYSQMQERDKRWREVGIPQEDALIAKVNEMGTEKYQNQQMGMAVGDITQGASDARGQTLRAMGRMGMNGNSGQMASMMARGNADQALAVAGTKNKMRQAFAQTDLANKFQLNGAMKGMAGMGDMSANLAINAVNAGKQGYMSGGGGGGGGGGGFGPMSFGSGGGGGASSGMSIANMGSSGILGGIHNGGSMAGNYGSNATNMYSAVAGNTVQPESFGSQAGGVLGLLTAGKSLYDIWKG